MLEGFTSYENTALTVGIIFCLYPQRLLLSKAAITSILLPFIPQLFYWDFQQRFQLVPIVMMFWDVDTCLLITGLRPPTHFTQAIKQTPASNGLHLLPIWAQAKALSHGTASAFLMTNSKFNVYSLPSHKWTSGCDNKCY